MHCAWLSCVPSGVWLVATAGVLTVLYAVYLQPLVLMRWLAGMFPRVLWMMQPPRHRHCKIAALTIDDAPTNATDEILDLLATYQCHATFFIIGSQAETHAAQLQRILADGHEIGNHTFYDKASAFLSKPAFEQSFQSTHALLTQAIGILSYILQHEPSST
jgi:peptidoglycan/xylan/chitin deacetylase (PgdA/CDA1 family)